MVRMETTLLEHGFYADASAMLRLPPSLFTNDLHFVTGWTHYFDAGVFLPMVAYREFLQKRIQELSKQFDKLLEFQDCAPSMRQLDRDHLEGELVRFVQAMLKKQHIQVIPTPDDLDLGSIVERALQHVPPFAQKGDRGFKDTIILLSVLKHAREAKHRRVFLIAHDPKAFQPAECRDLFEREGIEFQVAEGWAAAREVIQSYKAQAMHEEIRRRRDLLKRHTEENKDQLIELVQAARIHADFVGKLLWGTELGKAGRVTEIASCEFVSVARSWCDAVLEFDDGSERRAEFSCTATFGFNALFEPWGLYDTSALRMEEGTIVREATHPWRDPGPVDFARDFDFRGTVGVKAGDAFFDLKVSSIVLGVSSTEMLKTMGRYRKGH